MQGVFHAQPDSGGETKLFRLVERSPQRRGVAACLAAFCAATALRLGFLAVFAMAPLALAILSRRRRCVQASTALATSASVWSFTLAAHTRLWISPRVWIPAVPFLIVSAFNAFEGIVPFHAEPEPTTRGTQRAPQETPDIPAVRE